MKYLSTNCAKENQHSDAKRKKLTKFFSIFSKTTSLDLGCFHFQVFKWISRLQKLKHYNPKIPIVLVGNKTDLRSDASEQHISIEMGERLARRINAAIYLECSTSNEDQVEKVFEQTAWATLRCAEKRRKPKSQWFRKFFGRK